VLILRGLGDASVPADPRFEPGAAPRRTSIIRSPGERCCIIRAMDLRAIGRVALPWLVVGIAGCGGRVGYDAFGRDAAPDLVTHDDAAADGGTDGGPGAAGEVVVVPVTGLITTESGGTATFVVSLRDAPSADVTLSLVSVVPAEASVSPTTLTFTSANFASARTVTVTGVDDAVQDGDREFTIDLGVTSSVDPRYDAVDPDDVSGINHDDESPGLLISPLTGLSTSETGGVAMFTVSLQSQPSAAVLVPVMSSDLSEGTVIARPLVFEVASWNVPITVVVTGVDDFSADGDVAYSVRVGAPLSADSNYASLAAIDVAISNIDDESPHIVVVPTDLLTTTELGGTATFQITLGSQPTADVDLLVTSADVGEGTVAPATLTFTSSDWDFPQYVTATGVDDAIGDGPQAYEAIVHIAASADVGYLAVDDVRVPISNIDNETAGVQINPISGLLTGEDGSSATFSVVLNSEPVGDVMISLSSSDLSEGAPSVGALLFTSSDWDTPQIVTVTGNNDESADGDVAYSIITSAPASADAMYAGLDIPDVAITNIDNDVASIVAAPSAGLVTTETGGTASFDVVLSSQPAADVQIGLTSTDPSEGTLAPSTLTFTSANWNIAQSVLVTGANDVLADGSINYEVVLHPTASSDGTYLAVADEHISLTNADDETAGIVVNPTAGLVTSEMGGSATFTLVLTSQPTMNVTIPVSSARLTEGTVSPASVTFTALDWNVPQTVTVTGVDDHTVDGDTLYTVTNGVAVSGDSSYNGINAADVSVTNHATPLPLGEIIPVSTLALDFTGFSVALSADGNTVVFGAPQEDGGSTGTMGDPSMRTTAGAGAAFVYVRSGESFVLQAYIKASAIDPFDQFGTSVALSADGNTLAVSALLEDSAATGINGADSDDSALNSGAVYVFTRSGSTWSQQAYIKASNAQAQDNFGASVALSGDGDTLIATSPLESSDATGIDGDQMNNIAYPERCRVRILAKRRRMDAGCLCKGVGHERGRSFWYCVCIERRWFDLGAHSDACRRLSTRQWRGLRVREERWSVVAASACERAEQRDALR
jgi:hypothetical protein